MKFCSSLILFMFLICSGPFASGQRITSDTAYFSNGYRISIDKIDAAMGDSLLAGETPLSFGEAFRARERKECVVTDADSIKNFYLYDIAFVYDTLSHRWGKYFYLERMVCRNGMQIIFHYPAEIRGYYPEYDVISFDYPRRSISLATGEDQPLPTDILDSPSGRLRLLRTRSFYSDPVIFLQVRSGNGIWSTVADLRRLFGDYLDGFLYFWRDTNLYIVADDNNGYDLFRFTISGSEEQ